MVIKIALRPSVSGRARFAIFGKIHATDDTPPTCGIVVIELRIGAARPPLCITHVSAHMLVTDLRLEDIAAY